MKFKIDTNASYTRILPEGEALSATMADGLFQQCRAQQYTAEAPRFIVDFSGLPDAEATDAESVFEKFALLHEDVYTASGSLIFTGIGPALLQQIKREDLHHILNITPTLQEAIDMVNMELLERDLFNEDES